MSFVRRIMETIGLGESASKNTFECQDCGHTVESSREEDSYWLTCDRCDSRDLEKVGEQSV